MTLGRKYTFWFHEWSIPFVVKILAPLKTAIRLEDALQSKGWSDYIKRVFVKACISTYEHRCQYRTKAEKKNVDKVQILKDIRSAAVRAIRPPIEEIPTHYGGEQDTGRRAAKQASKESDAESLMSVASTVEDYSSKDE